MSVNGQRKAISRLCLTFGAATIAVGGFTMGQHLSTPDEAPVPTVTVTATSTRTAPQVAPTAVPTVSAVPPTVAPAALAEVPVEEPAMGQGTAPIVDGAPLDQRPQYGNAWTEADYPTPVLAFARSHCIPHQVDPATCIARAKQQQYVADRVAEEGGK